MPDNELTGSQTTTAARFAHLATALKILQDMLTMYDEAEELYISLPRHQRQYVDDNDDAVDMNVTFALARVAPKRRSDHRRQVEEAIRNLTEMIEHPDFQPLMRFDHRDLGVVVDFINSLDLLAPRSRREAARFFDAMRANDVGSLVAITVPPRGGTTKQKLEMRFTHELSADIRESLGLPKAFLSPQN